MIVWLLVVEPVSLALTLDHTLARMPTFGVTGWTLVAMRIVLAGLGITLAGRLRTRDGGAWRAVALWSCGAIAVTLPSASGPSCRPVSHRPRRVSPPSRPSYCDVMLALVSAWLARADAAVDGDGAGTRDSS